MRLEKLTAVQEDHWRAQFGRRNWIFGSLQMSVTLPEFAEGRPKLDIMHFGYYLQPLHLSAIDREDLPRRLVWSLAKRKPMIDFLEMMGAGVRIPHCFPPGFSLERVLRLTLEEIEQLPVQGEN